jgi:hypothetical protein
MTGNGKETSAHIYSPLSTVTVNGTPGFTGWIIGKTLTFLGTSKLHYNETGKDNTPQLVALVR